MTATGTPRGRKRKIAETKSEDPSAKESSDERPQNGHSQTNSIDDSLQFEVQCPVGQTKASKAKANDDFFEASQDCSAHHLPNITYSISPGSLWNSMSVYKHCKMLGQNFSQGDIVYVNHILPVPTPPGEDASDIEKLAYDKATLWIGRILECRASDPSHVFLRVMWLYWPDELPMGRQIYHGSRELVASNSIDVVDAQSITSHAEVSFWDEYDDEIDAKLGEWYWRQTFDLNKYTKWRKAGRKGGNMATSLGQIIRHCVCETEYNPDDTMFKCTNKKCGLWNHEECLADAILEDVYGKSLRGELKDIKVSESLPESAVSPGKKFLFTGLLDSIASRVSTPDAADKDSGDATKPQTFDHRDRPRGKPTPWSGKFSCTLRNEDAQKANGRAIAKIEDLQKRRPKKAESRPKEWQQIATCLRCGTSMS